jgi:hypothetical protein
LQEQLARKAPVEDVTQIGEAGLHLGCSNYLKRFFKYKGKPCINGMQHYDASKSHESAYTSMRQLMRGRANNWFSKRSFIELKI